MQTMLRMIGFGDNAGSGFPKILKTWADNGWQQPELDEDIVLNQVTLTLLLSASQAEEVEESEEKVEEKPDELEEKSDESPELNSMIFDSLLDGQKEILELMEKGRSYSRQKIADVLGIKKSRTAQLLNELISLDLCYGSNQGQEIYQKIKRSGLCNLPIFHVNVWGNLEVKSPESLKNQGIFGKKGFNTVSRRLVAHLSSQNGILPKPEPPRGRTAERLAKEYGIGHISPTGRVM